MCNYILLLLKKQKCNKIKYLDCQNFFEAIAIRKNKIGNVLLSTTNKKNDLKFKKVIRETNIKKHSSKKRETQSTQNLIHPHSYTYTFNI